MEQEQAERFVVAAEHDYEMAVGWYCAMVEGKAEGPEDIVQPRADVLAAQQVLALARSEEERARHAADWGHGGAQGVAKWTSGMAEMAREAGEAGG